MLKVKFLFGEAMLGFVPPFIIWIIAIYMALPSSVAGVFSGEILSFVFLALVILGAVGVWGAFHLIKKLFWPEAGLSIRKYRNHLVCGCLATALGGLAFVGINNFLALYMVVPTIVTVHLYQVCNENS